MRYCGPAGGRLQHRKRAMHHKSRGQQYTMSLQYASGSELRIWLHEIPCMNFKTRLTSKRQTCILRGPANYGHNEKDPPSASSIVASRTDHSQNGSHDGKSNTIGDKDDTSNWLRPRTPWQNASARRTWCDTGRARTSNRVIPRCSGQTLEQCLCENGTGSLVHS